MSWKTVIYTIPTLLFSSMYALVEHRIDEKQPLSLIFSKTSHNRISVKEGSVERIFGDESYFNISIDRATGNAFVNVLRDIHEPITLTVTTSSGLIQDLTIASSEKPSEHLILKEEEKQEDLIETTANFHGPTVDFLNKILEGSIPLGYGFRSVDEQDHLPLPNPLIASIIKVFEGPFEEVHVYSIKNSGKNPIIINSNALKKEQASWVFLNAHELKAKEQALCIISFPKSEG